MAWIEGEQIRPVNQFVGINEELKKIRGYIDDDHQAKVLLYKFLRQNITFATDVIMGVKLFPFQHIAIKAMLDTDYTLNVWSRGLSKCGFWHSLVPTNRGLKRMKDVEVGDYILSKDGANIVEDKVINPVEKTYKVTTSRGYESEGLDYHRVLTLTKDLDLEYKFSKDLKPGDCLVMRKGGVDTDQIDIFKNFNPEKKARKDTIIINPSNLSIDEWYYFFGLLIGDGGFREEVISITSEDKEIEEFLIYFAKQLNLNLRIANREDTNAKDYRISNKSLKEFLKFCGFESNIKAKDKIIPLKLLECSKPNSQQLLRGLFDRDGFVSIAPRRRNSNGVKIGFTSSSIELIRQVRSLLLINDIIANTNVCFPGGSSNFGEKTYECNKAWSILIMGFENVKEFKDNIRFKIKRKQDKLSIIDKAKYQNGESSNYIPYVGEYLIKNLNKKSIRRHKEGIKLSFRKNTSRRLANFITEFVEEKHANKIKKLTDENLFYDYVKNVEEGFEKTVDLQVENEHCYVSDGIINHNSFSCGIFAVLDAIFNQGIQIGILSPSFRQCLEKDHLVKTKNGLKKIKDVNKGEEIWARYKWQKIIDKWENELSEGIKLTTKKGYSLKGKNQHRVLTYNPEQREFVYKDLIDLKIGDSIPISISEDFVGQDVLKDFDYSIKYHHCNKPLLKIHNQQDFYYMLGSFIGDGNFRKRQSSQYSFSFTSGDTESSDWMEDYMNSILPENSVDRNLKEGGNTESVECNSNALGKLFEFMGYKANSIAINKEIPEKVLLSKKENISYFLKGLMDTDGTAVFGKKSKEVTLSTSSLKVAQQFQLLLLNFGIISKLGTEKARGEMEICGVKTFGNTSYKVRITGYHNIKKYYDQIGFKLDRKNKRIEKYLNSCKDRAKNRCIPVPKIGHYLDKKYKGVNVRSNPTKARLKKALESGKITEREDIKLCNDIINEKIYFDTVSSLELEESIKTIDIEVENEHCYWGSGFINHNSKQIFRKIEDIASKPEAVYLNQVIGGRGGISRNNDEWIMNVGASTIRALPLGCLKGDTNIFYENGLREIADDFDVHESGEWINKSEKVWSNNDFELSDKKFYHGMAEAKKITSDKGYEIEGTLNHRIKVLYPDGIIRWKHFEDIKDGDYVLIDRSKKQLPNKSKITSNQAYFCGAMVGDGSWVNKYYLQFTNTDEEFADKIKNITKYDWKLYDDRHYYALDKDNTKEFRDFWGVDYLYSHEKYIPRKILSSGNECISKFLSGLFDADGHCQVSTAKGGVAVTIGYTTTSEKLAKQIQQCLLIFGIISKVKNRQRQINGNCKKTPKKIWEILITGKDARIFCSEVGFGISRKQNKLEKAISQQKRDVSCLDGIPYIKNDVYNFVKNNKPTNQKYKNSCSPYKIKKKKIITFDFLSKILERYEGYECSFIQKLKSFNNNNYYFDKIVSVEDSQCETFDISVPSNNTYCANGFVSHNSGEKLRGFRFHRIIIDEMLLMPERIYNEVILPFLAVSENPDEQEEIAAWEDKLIAQGKMKEEDRYTWPNNKLIALSSASYQFEYLYEFYQIYEKLITEKDNDVAPGSNPASRAIIHLAYDVAPRKLYDENLLKQSKATMSQSQFDREFGAVFTDESSGYFKVSKMKECIIPYGDNPSVEVQGDPNEEYIVSMDPSWAENDSSDNFALHVYKLHPKTRTSTVVHSYALAGARMKEHMKYLLYILQNFNVVALIGDYMGSVTFLNGCNESKLFKDAGIELKFLEAKFDKPEEYKEQILEAQKQYNKEDYKFCYLQNPSTGYIRQGNQYLQSCYDHKRVRFAAEAVDDAFNSQIAKRINGFDKIKYREKFGDEDGRGYAEDMKNIDAKMVDFVEHQKDMLSLIRAECSVIEIKTSSQGHQTFDLPATLKKTTGPKKARKDSYSAMVLGTWMVKIYYDLMFTEKQKVETFMPRFIK